MTGVGFAFLIEILVCSFLHPDINTNVSGISLILLVVNTILMLGALSNSVKDREGKRLNHVIMVSFLLHLVILLWDVYARNIYVLPNAEGDAVAYHMYAISYAFGGRRAVVDLTDYSFYIGILYRAIGIQRLTAQFINIYFAMYSIVLVARITHMIGLEKTVRYKTIRLLCFLPNFLLITSILLQESFIAFCLTACVYHFTKWWRYKSKQSLVQAALFSVVGALLHMGGIVGLIGIAVAYFFIEKKDNRLNYNPRRLFFAIIVGILAISIYSRFGGATLDKVGGSISVESILENSGQTDRLSDADYLIGNMGMTSTAGLILLTPIRAIYFVCSPLPWMWRGVSDLIAFFGSALFYIATVRSAWKAFKVGDEEKPLRSYMFSLMIILVFAAVMFGWGVSNTGTALRHREKFTCLCGILYAVSQSIQLEKKKT